MQIKKHPYDVSEKNRKVLVEMIASFKPIIPKAKVVVESIEKNQRGTFSEKWESFPMEPSKAIELAVAIQQKKQIDLIYTIGD